MKRAQYQIANISFHQSVINVTYQTIENLKFSFIYAGVKIFKKTQIWHMFLEYLILKVFRVSTFLL